MKIKYEPKDIHNFHNSPTINLVVSGLTATDDYGTETYVVSHGQAKKIQAHFCGCGDCKCPASGVTILDYDRDLNPTSFGIPVKWCK